MAGVRPLSCPVRTLKPLLVPAQPRFPSRGTRASRAMAGVRPRHGSLGRGRPDLARVEERVGRGVVVRQQRHVVRADGSAPAGRGSRASGRARPGATGGSRSSGGAGTPSPSPGRRRRRASCSRRSTGRRPGRSPDGRRPSGRRTVGLVIERKSFDDGPSSEPMTFVTITPPGASWSAPARGTPASSCGTGSSRRRTCRFRSGPSARRVTRNAGRRRRSRAAAGSSAARSTAARHPRRRGRARHLDVDPGKSRQMPLRRRAAAEADEEDALRRRVVRDAEVEEVRVGELGRERRPSFMALCIDESKRR